MTGHRSNGYLPSRNSLQQNNWSVNLHWIQSHVGIAGNEIADELTKKGAEMHQPNIDTSLTYAYILMPPNTIPSKCMRKQAEVSSGLLFTTVVSCRQSPTGQLQ